MFATGNAKPPGTIGAFFTSLSGADTVPLPQKYADLKRKLVPDEKAERQLEAGWKRLLAVLKENNPKWAEKGTANIPEVAFQELISGDNDSPAARSVKDCGVVIVKGVVDEELALSWKESVREYVKTNPKAKGFPEHDPQVFDLFWTPPQIAARTHPRMLQTITRMNKLCSVSPESAISLTTPIVYADRCRIRHPGDTSFALGPHSDSGTIERWEDETYRSVYKEILTRWEDWDPWNIDGRVEACIDLYDSPGGSSVFRTFQGWLSLSSCGPGEGTLRVHPSVKHSIAYFWMRPFFAPIRSKESFESNAEFLAAENWRLDLDQSSFPGTPPGRGSEFSNATHPHLELDITLTSIPKVSPGDYVFWHCDGIHAVENKHTGTGDSSVMYIGAAPLTRQNAQYLVKQKTTFVEGFPPPDFPGGVGESGFIGRANEKYLTTDAAKAGMGYGKFIPGSGATEGEKLVIQHANEILGFA
ncbi:hypothetical protein BDZ94DRAFT_1309772 [Collybia nuda]|uniref:DUF1479-domain-containing protein n=1 Tax=Collybia nuda TaxID=64659 RepID=A0A9P5Y4W6_9AGAR|nr:hypothetical protein BDZ94DRAFT_1309772 [Collybia nuda]